MSARGKRINDLFFIFLFLVSSVLVSPWETKPNDFSEVLTFAWSEIKEERRVQAKVAKQNAWMAPIGKKILDESGITLDEYLSVELSFVTKNRMGTANLFETEKGRTIWLSSRQEEMIAAYAKFSK